jgi:hypothetical protein
MVIRIKHVSMMIGNHRHPQKAAKRKEDAPNVSFVLFTTDSVVSIALASPLPTFLFT